MTTEQAAETVIAGLKGCLFKELDLGGLHSRNPTAHKWKAPYRSLQLREVVHWRMTDLVDQALTLYKGGHVLGARILLRSALETVAMLVYLNQQMAKVLDGTLAFHAFSAKTEALMLGSRNGGTPIGAINILTIFEGCDKEYPGIKAIYEKLCESAHPNYEGMSAGYTIIDHEADTVIFKNRWIELHGGTLPDRIMTCIETFNYEYDKVWPAIFERLEKWIEANDAELEATRPPPVVA